MEHKTANFLVQFDEPTRKEIMKFGVKCCLNLIASLKDRGFDFQLENTDELVEKIVVKIIREQ